jgi:hypothetical protein
MRTLLRYLLWLLLRSSGSDILSRPSSHGIPSQFAETAWSRGETKAWFCLAARHLRRRRTSLYAGGTASFILLSILLSVPAFAQAPPLQLENLSRLSEAQATLTAVFKGFNRGTRESTYDLTLANVSGTALHGPVYATIAGITGGVTVKNQAGTTTSGVPYFVVSTADVAVGAGVTLPLVFHNPANVRFSFDMVGYATPVAQAPPLAVEITRPGTLITVGSTPILVEGTINDASATLTLNGAVVSHAGGLFAANVALNEGHNAIVARATNVRNEEATATISVSLDRTPPYMTIESPLAGAVVSSASISVAGLVNDIVRGTVSEGQANVTVNGRPASVANRSYLATDVPLQEGLNTIRVQGSDQVGNTGTAEVHVTYQVPTTQFIELLSGQAQQAQIRQVLGQSLRVKLQKADGAPVPGKTVIFRVSQGDGVVGVGRTDEGNAVLVVSDENGTASTQFKLGSRAGSGNNRVTARAVGFEGEVVFVASATPQPGNKVSVNSGNNQRGAANQPLPLPFVIVVTDDGANVIEGAQVEFSVLEGGGRFQNGETHVTVATDSDGRANAKLTLGSTLGLDVQRVSAVLVGTQLSAGFTASALQSGPPGATAISGVVLDNQDHPLPNVTMRVEGTTRQAVTDDQGRFRITEAPVGPVHLIADGSTTTVPGEWPTLPYNIVTVAGADNPLPSPVYLVKLDTAHAVTVGAEDREVTLPEVPGFKLTVKAGSVTFPNGDRVGQLSVTPVNVSKIPMPPPNGMQPQFIVTIQPTGARFDPPAPLQLPNVDGHPAGAQVEMYSFDHDLEEFVAIGLGTVSADGTTIASNIGVGIIKAGWHCGSQPGGSGCVGTCPVCQAVADTCASSSCVTDDTDLRVAFEDIPHDCARPECSGGAVRQVAEASDLPPDAPGDCKRDQCFTSPVNDDTDLPSNLCLTCRNGAPDSQIITNLDFDVEGVQEKWKVMPPSGGAQFTFNASVEVSRCAQVIFQWNFGDGVIVQSGAPSVSHTYDAPGEYSVHVFVTCRPCPAPQVCETCPLTVLTMFDAKVVVLKITSQTVVNFNRSRTRLGVGEEVQLQVQPAKDLTWALQGPGRLSTSQAGSTNVFAAPSVAGISQIRLSKPGLLDPVDALQLTTVAPDGFIMRVADGGELPMVPDSMGVHAHVELLLFPSDVSFHKIEVADLTEVPPLNASGYFLPFPTDRIPPEGLRYPAPQEWLAQPQIPGFTSGINDFLYKGRPGPWTPGTFLWDTHWFYRMAGDPAFTPRQFATMLQTVESTGTNGTVEVRKAGVCLRRDLPNNYTGC